MAVTSQIRADDFVATSLWYERPGVVDLRRQSVSPAAGCAIVRATWSAISRGTERLVFSGRVPASEYERMRAPFQAGEFPFPVKYGYCSVGKVISDNDIFEQRPVFVLHPHQDVFAAPVDALIPLPEGLPERRATLAANMETALNAVWDSGAGPGDHIVVTGTGIVGLLIAYLCARLPGAEVVAVDPLPQRATIAESFGARFATPDTAGQCVRKDGADIVFHASASAAGLALAVALAGFETRIVEASWYGEGDVPVPLGGAFHSRRLHLVSTQVGHVAASRRPRWSYRRRLAKALDLLGDHRLDALITEEFEFADLPAKLPAYFGKGGDSLAAVVRYGD